MSESTHLPLEPGLDELIERFEQAAGRDTHADIAEFLPSPDRSDYLTVLCELVRVDMEYGRRRWRPTRLEEYERRFPALFRDPARAREVAFEEYRSRQQAGDRPSPSEYRSRFGGDATDWPPPLIDKADSESENRLVSANTVIDSSGRHRSTDLESLLGPMRRHANRPNSSKTCTKSTRRPLARPAA